MTPKQHRRFRQEIEYKRRLKLYTKADADRIERERIRKVYITSLSIIAIVSSILIILGISL